MLVGPLCRRVALPIGAPGIARREHDQKADDHPGAKLHDGDAGQQPQERDENSQRERINRAPEPDRAGEQAGNRGPFEQ